MDRAEYRIAWRSKVTGAEGHGDWKSRHLPAHPSWIVAKANAEHPEIHHWSEIR
jgi:hypothetical protein